MYIYKLVFNDGNFYVGKTTGSIEARLKTHCSKMKTRKHHSIKVQKVYDKLQEFPTMDILEKVSFSDINIKEEYWINKLEATTKGLNIKDGSEGPGSGELNHQARYTLDDYMAAVVFLSDTDMSLVDISKELDMSLKTIQHISGGASHTYLQELLPKEYANMISKKGTRKHPAREYDYYPDLISPEGKIYKVVNIQKFATEHGLDSSSLSKVIRGLVGYRTTKGWKVYNE